MDMSIIIVSWNAKEYLLKCLKSVQNETVDHLTEIIVIDNASTDGSPEVVRDRFPDVTLICNDNNLGFARANNIGIKQSKGKYVCLVNSDIFMLKDCFRNMFDYMDSHAEIGMLGPRILNPDRSLQPSCMGFPTLWNMFCRALALDSIFPKSKVFGGRLMTFWRHDAIRVVEVLNGCFWMVRREAMGQVGLLDENFFMYSEDIDWCKRFRDGGWDVVFFPGAETIHYGGASSSNAPIKYHIEMQRARLQYWKKHHRRYAWISYLFMNLLHEIVRIIGQSAVYTFFPSKRTHVILKIKKSIACIQWLANTNILNSTKKSGRHK